MSELYVVFRVGEAEYALSAREVARLEPCEGVTPVPGGPKHLAGVAQVRGRFIPVIDLRVRFGLDPAPTGPDTRLVVGTVGARTVALRVDRARETVRLSEGDVAAPPRMIAERTLGYVRGVARVAGRALLVMDLPTVVGEEGV
ncbi:MAG: chemotaxis protein CheW [Polyangiales bacterium]